MTQGRACPASDPIAAASAVPAGAWAVAVSGGADSVALLELLRPRGDLSLHVVHLDHETRGGESGRDAEFVAELAKRHALPCTIARRSEIERSFPRVPANKSARFRAARLELFRRTVTAQNLRGVLLAHHADDQAETIFQRLLRGSGPAGLMGMNARAVVSGVTLLRPLLGVRRQTLREILRDRGVTWREDQSNRAPNQQRNCVRSFLSRRPELHDLLIEVSDSCERLVRWLREQGTQLGDDFELTAVTELAPPVARETLRRWLARHAGKSIEINSTAVERLFEMANDRAAPARQHFPGGLLIRRRGGRIFVDRSDNAPRIARPSQFKDQ